MILGRDCKAYVASALMATPAAAVPTAAENHTAFASATEFKLITDADIGSKVVTVDSTTRGSVTDEETIVSIGYSVSFTAQFNNTDATLQQLITAFNTKAPIAVAALTGSKDVIGSQGPAGNWNVTKFDTKEGLKNIVTADIELSANSYVSWYKVAS